MEATAGLADLIDEIADILNFHEPVLADTVAEAIAAGWLAGGHAVTRALPPSFKPPQPPGTPAPPQPPGEPVIRFPQTEAAVRDLHSRGVVTKEDFDAMTAAAKAQAFTVARQASADAVAGIRDALVENLARGGTLREFAEAVEAAGGVLSPAHVENVYRTNVMEAYSRGQREILDHPLVADELPYVAYTAVHDSRVRPNHLALERHGIDGTNVYRRDDPVVNKFYPPWDFNCRCHLIPLSVEDAAGRGVNEAREWLRTGEPPAAPRHVEHPPFDLPEGWARLSADVWLGWQNMGPAPGGKTKWKNTETGEWRQQKSAPGTGRAVAPPPTPPDLFAQAEQEQAATPAAGAPAPAGGEESEKSQKRLELERQALELGMIGPRILGPEHQRELDTLRGEREKRVLKRPEQVRMVALEMARHLAPDEAKAAVSSAYALGKRVDEGTATDRDRENLEDLKSKIGTGDASIAYRALEELPEIHARTRKAGEAPAAVADPLAAGQEMDIPAQGGRGGFRAKVFKVENGQAFIGYADQDRPQTSMPAESLRHFVNDLSGRVEAPPGSGDADVDAVTSGRAKFLGKGDDGLVFQSGDNVVKVSTTVPFQPFNPGHRSPQQAADMLARQAETSERMRADGIPGILPTKLVRHGDKAFAVRPYVDIPEKLTREQLDEARGIVSSMHEKGWELGDEVQVGVRGGRVYLFDTGKARRLDMSNPKYALDGMRSDEGYLEMLYSRNGERYEPALTGDRLKRHWEELYHYSDLLAGAGDRAEAERVLRAASKAKYDMARELFKESRGGRMPREEYFAAVKKLNGQMQEIEGRLGANPEGATR